MSAATRRFGALAALVLAGLATPPAHAAEGPLRVSIRDAGLARDGASRIVVAVGGLTPGRSLDGSAFAVSESGRPVRGVRVSAFSAATVPSVAVLVVDTSGSTAGAPLAAAQAAASSFAQRLPSWFRLGLVSFGPEARVAATLSAERGAVLAGVAALRSAGETALYDAVVLAARELGQAPGQHDMIVFSDGGDTVSKATLEDAVATAKAAKARVHAVALQTKDLDVGSLAALADGTGGTVSEVARPEALEAAFANVAGELSSQYVLSYRAPVESPDELDVRVSVTDGSSTAHDLVVVLNPRRGPAAAAKTSSEPGAWAGSPATLAAGLGAVFVALAIVLGGIVPAPRRRSARALEHALGYGGPRPVQQASRLSHGAHRVGQAIARLRQSLADRGSSVPALMERLKARPSATRDVEAKLELAGWRLRPSELRWVRVLAGIGGGILVAAATRAPIVGLAAGVILSVAPRVLLDRSARRKTEAFAAQLPDTLQLLSASLEAGYALVQGLEAVVQESPAPTSTEFSRALAEVRIGMQLTDALAGMAERLGSEDFHWVVVALNIQREVGGNLASLLKTSAETLRERSQLRRQIRVLSAEGRVSAAALGILPIGLAAYLAIVNPTYVEALVTTPVGRALSLVAALLMAAGGLWLRKLVRIEA